MHRDFDSAGPPSGGPVVNRWEAGKNGADSRIPKLWNAHV